MSVTRKLISAVRNIAEAAPDYVYEKVGGHACKYVQNGAGSCIVGQGALAAGVPLETVAEWDQAECGSGFGDVCDRIDIDCGSDAAQWLIEVQSHQDNGIPWGEAVAAADSNVDLFESYR